MIITNTEISSGATTQIISITMFIVSEVMPILKHLIPSLRRLDVNSITQMIYYLLKYLAVWIYDYVSGNKASQLKAEQEAKQMEMMVKILDERLKNVVPNTNVQRSHTEEIHELSKTLTDMKSVISVNKGVSNV